MAIPAAGVDVPLDSYPLTGSGSFPALRWAISRAACRVCCLSGVIARPGTSSATLATRQISSDRNSRLCRAIFAMPPALSLPLGCQHSRLVAYRNCPVHCRQILRDGIRSGQIVLRGGPGALRRIRLSVGQQTRLSGTAGPRRRRRSSTAFSRRSKFRIAVAPGSRWGISSASSTPDSPPRTAWHSSNGCFVPLVTRRFPSLSLCNVTAPSNSAISSQCM